MELAQLWRQLRNYGRKRIGRSSKLQGAVEFSRPTNRRLYFREGEVPSQADLSVILLPSLPSLPSVQKSSLPFRCPHATEKFGIKVRASSLDFDHTS